VERFDIHAGTTEHAGDRKGLLGLSPPPEEEAR